MSKLQLINMHEEAKKELIQATGKKEEPFHLSSSFHENCKRSAREYRKKAGASARALADVHLR